MTQNSNPQATMVQEEARQLIESADQIRTSLTNVVRAYTSFEKTYDDWHKELVVKIDPAADRITSYNVCYTKLLRSALPDTYLDSIEGEQNALSMSSYNFV